MLKLKDPATKTWHSQKKKKKKVHHSREYSIILIPKLRQVPAFEEKMQLADPKTFLDMERISLFLRGS